MSGSSDVTRILEAAAQGDRKAAGDLLPLVYEELRKPATHRLAQEMPGHTLQATGLVHEGYLPLVGGEAPQRFSGRGHFFAAAARRCAGSSWTTSGTNKVSRAAAAVSGSALTT